MQLTGALSSHYPVNEHGCTKVQLMNILNIIPFRPSAPQSLCPSAPHSLSPSAPVPHSPSAPLSLHPSAPPCARVCAYKRERVCTRLMYVALMFSAYFSDKDRLLIKRCASHARTTKNMFSISFTQHYIPLFVLSLSLSFTFSLCLSLSLCLFNLLSLSLRDIARVVS